jgi:hypothetical protein
MLAAGFGPRLQRVLVEPMLAGGVEVHIGVVQEPVFGPAGGVRVRRCGHRGAR